MKQAVVRCLQMPLQYAEFSECIFSALLPMCEADSFTAVKAVPASCARANGAVRPHEATNKAAVCLC